MECPPRTPNDPSLALTLRVQDLCLHTQGHYQPNHFPRRLNQRKHNPQLATLPGNLLAQIFLWLPFSPHILSQDDRCGRATSRSLTLWTQYPCAPGLPDHSEGMGGFGALWYSDQRDRWFHYDRINEQVTSMQEWLCSMSMGSTARGKPGPYSTSSSAESPDEYGRVATTIEDTSASAPEALGSSFHLQV